MAKEGVNKHLFLTLLSETSFDTEDLFRLRDLAFAVEISLAKARKDDSEIKVKNKEELFHALTDKETFTKILDQGAEAHEVGDDMKSYLRENRGYILDYFLRIYLSCPGLGRIRSILVISLKLDCDMAASLRDTLNGIPFV